MLLKSSVPFCRCPRWIKSKLPGFPRRTTVLNTSSVPEFVEHQEEPWGVSILTFWRCGASALMTVLPGTKGLRRGRSFTLLMFGEGVRMTGRSFSSNRTCRDASQTLRVDCAYLLLVKLRYSIRVGNVLPLRNGTSLKHGTFFLLSLINHLHLIRTGFSF